MSAEPKAPELSTVTPQCQFFVQRKKRLCRMTVKPGRSYCGEHEPQPATQAGEVDKRIPCPNDPKHTCYASKLEKHLAICNARRTKQPAYIVENINAPEAVESCPRRPLSAVPRDELIKLIDKVNHLYAKYLEEHITSEPPQPIHHTVAVEFAEPDRTESSLRHLRQTSALLWLAEREGLVRDNTCYVELGAGKGQLSYYACHAWCGAGRTGRVLAVDRAPLRHKRDNKLRSHPPSPGGTGGTARPGGGDTADRTQQENGDQTANSDTSNQVNVVSDTSKETNGAPSQANKQYDDHKHDTQTVSKTNGEANLDSKMETVVNTSNTTEDFKLQDQIKGAGERGIVKHHGDDTEDFKLQDETKVSKDIGAVHSTEELKLRDETKSKDGLVKQVRSEVGGEVASRLRADLAHLALAAVPAVAASTGVVGLAKHLCGVATDYALRCVAAPDVLEKTHGVVLATCCHHRCELAPYVGAPHLQELGIDASEFNIMLGVVSWATCGDGRSRQRRAAAPGTPADPADPAHPAGGATPDPKYPITREEREAVGIKAKALLDYGRVQWLRARGLRARLARFVPANVSPENLCLVASRP